MGLMLGLQTWGVASANLIALLTASMFGYFLNRNVTFRGDRDARWVSNPGMFATTALLAGSVDMALLLAMNAADFPLPLAKAVAVCCAGLVRWVTYRWILLTEVRRELSARIERPPVEGPYRLSVVIPAYNEEDRIGDTIDVLTAHLGQLSPQDLGDRPIRESEPRDLDNELDEHSEIRSKDHLIESPKEHVERRASAEPDFELIIVDDSSTDDTAAIADARGVTVVRQPVNKGKGAAVRAGVAASTGRAIVFTDADLAYSPSLIDEILNEIERGWDMVVGSRRHEQTSTVREQRNVRKIGGWLVNRFTHLVLLGHFRDTQCGLKGFRGDIGRTVFDRCQIDGFAFDVELFAIAEQDQLSLKEIPVVVQNRAGSSVSLIGDTAALVRDLLRIRRSVGAGRYQPSEEQRKLLESRVQDSSV